VNSKYLEHELKKMLLCSEDKDCYEKFLQSGKNISDPEITALVQVCCLTAKQKEKYMDFKEMANAEDIKRIVTKHSVAGLGKTL